jgi:phosphate transport system protein
MSRRLFEEWLAKLQENVLTLGVLAEQSIGQSVALLQQRDFEGAHELIQQDRAIDARRYAIEAEALTLIVTQQPIARDMRTIAAAIFIANELERIADYAKGIARVNIRMGDEPLLKPLIDIPAMATAGQKMLHRSLQAYVQCDAALARAIIPEDDTVDALYDQIYTELMIRIMETPARMRQANLLLMAGHNLERTADRATNICERVIYVATGELQDTGWKDSAL